MVVHKPYKGKDEELLAAIKLCYHDLYKTGLISDAAPRLMKTSGNYIIFMFEWKSSEAREASPQHPVVQEHWMKLSKLSEFENGANLPEFQNNFPFFETIEWDDWNKNTNA